MDNRISWPGPAYNTAPVMAQAEPEMHGTGSRQLEQAHKAILKDYPKMHSMLVVRNGKLIFERYYGNYHAGMLNDLWSATKSLVSLLGGGLNEERQLIPQSWLEQAFRKQKDSYPAYGDYGYRFWNGRISGQPYVLAHGRGGQQLWLLPELDAAIVFTAESAVSRWRNPRRLLEQHIIPAMNP